MCELRVDVDSWAFILFCLRVNAKVWKGLARDGQRYKKSQEIYNEVQL